jgi:hypothetical protein
MARNLLGLFDLITTESAEHIEKNPKPDSYKFFLCGLCALCGKKTIQGPA